MPGKPTVLTIIFIAAVLAGVPAPSRATGGDLLVLETVDPAGDRRDILRPEDPYPGGILRGARMVVRKVPVARGPKTDRARPGHVYVPVELTILVDGELTGGEVQLCIFSHLPPIHIEQIITRDSILRGEGDDEKRILLDTQSAVSLFTGMEEVWDREILAFRETDYYQDCFFETDPEERAEGLRRAARFSIHSGTTYRFPPSPRFYWRNIPPLSVSTSLAVREIDGLIAGPLKSLVSDTMRADWREVTAP